MFGSLREFRKSKRLSQEDFAKKLGLGEKWRNYPNWETGRSPIPQDIKDVLTGPKWKYVGPWPDEEDVPASREDLAREIEGVRREMRAEVAALRAEVRQMAEWARREENKEHKALGAALAECLRKLGGGPETPLAELIAPDPK